MTSTHNINTGQGSQNNNHAGALNVHYGDGQITQVSGGEVNFVKHVNTTASSPLKILSDAIAGVGASHKAEQQFLRGACLEGTRESSLAAIDGWASAKGPEASPIRWLSGSAGVGKSAIALSVAKSFEDRGLLSSSFFFFRTDPKRNTPSALVLTIAYELAITTPLMRNFIEQRVSADPRILEASLEQQFHELIIAPSLIWSRQRSLWGAPVVPNIIVIDGIDECGDEKTQLRILSIIQSIYRNTPHFPLRFLICSRPEAWICEAFDTGLLCQLTRFVCLDNDESADSDINRYYLHHFEKIAASRGCRQIRFPNPWPSKKDRQTLVGRSSGQFVYASTLVKFIEGTYDHPIEQLRIILDGAGKLSMSPYHDLDCLYQVILRANPVREELILILASIIILPEHEVAPTPAVIEGVLGLPSGQVTLTLRGMYSVLKIGDWTEDIELYHTSFQDYLVDCTRSHIDMAAQKYTIARRWLQSVSIDRLRNLRCESGYCSLEGLLARSTYPRTYSDEQLNDNNCFDGLGWIPLCTSIPQPTRDLLDGLWSVDLAAVFVTTSYLDFDLRSWTDLFKHLTLWVWKYLFQPCCAADEVDLVEALMHRLREIPRCFHLEWRPGVGPLERETIYAIVQYATECPAEISCIDWDHHPVLSECHCDLSGENETYDPKHVAYQDACMEYAKTLTSNLTELTRGNKKEADSDIELEWIFRNLVESALLKHCRLGTELILLCRTFLELVNGYPSVFDQVEGEERKRGRANLLEWIEVRVVHSGFKFSSSFYCIRFDKSSFLIDIPGEIH
ncbi:hypothetical protein PM082_020846 [Marasmius tenuissimus]|nr:hypothetical protein PM082_020846 [Marasmius tenuissimus]